MAKTASMMMALGTQAPPFSLPDTQGQLVRLEDFADKDALLVMFICNHCPYVIHVAPELARLGRDYGDRVALVAINSNDAQAYPADRPEAMAIEKQRWGYPFPYLYDQTQEVALAYQAACTPDFYLFDADRRLVYRGQLDDSRPYRIASGHYDDRDGKAHGADMRAALDALLDGLPLPEPQRPSIGCNLKWKPGNEPNYFG